MLNVAHRTHIIHGLLEVDVPKARRHIREHKARTGESLSFTSFTTTCLGKAIDMNKYMQACRNWRGQLVLYDEVDVSTEVEIDIDGRKFPVGHIIRGTSKRSFREIHDEIRAVQAAGRSSKAGKFARRVALLPGPVRTAFYSIASKTPSLLKAFAGTVLMTSVGIFGEGSGWGIPLAGHTLSVTLGGIGEKPGIVDGRIEIRKYLNVTLRSDHDIIDDAPAARFTQRFKELIESGYGIIEQDRVAWRSRKQRFEWKRTLPLNRR